jgi:hypothetical protein
MSTSTVKLSILLSPSGQVVGASRPRDYKPAKAGEEPNVTTALAAGPGHSVVEVEVPANLADLSASDFLTRLSQEAAVRTALANVVTSGEASISSQAPVAGGKAPISGQASHASPTSMAASFSSATTVGPTTGCAGCGGATPSATSPVTARTSPGGIVTSGSI